MWKKTWSPEQEKFLINNISNMTYSQLAEKFNKTINSVYVKAKGLGLSKREEYSDGQEAKLELHGRLMMKEYKLDVKVGDKVKVVASDYDSKKLSTKKLIKGEVIYKNDSFITIQGENYKESFLIADFYAGAAKLIKKEGQARCN